MQSVSKWDVLARQTQTSDAKLVPVLSSVGCWGGSDACLVYMLPSLPSFAQ